MTTKLFQHPEIKRMVLHPDDTLFRALRVLEDSGEAMSLVCAGDGCLVGTLTDGDVRRALLGGGSLEKTTVGVVMCRHFTAVDQRAGRAEVLDMMRARGISHVPIVEKDGGLVGVHTLQELIGAKLRPNTAVIMAGGKGTRLRPLTADLPKPMILVAGRPILERLILHLMAFGIRRFHIAVNYLPEVVEGHFGDGSSLGCQIEYLREDRPLGTGGALSLLPSRPAEPILLTNGDLVTQADVGSLLDFHTAKGYVATMGVRPYSVGIPFGVAEVREGELVEFREKPTQEFLVNAGIYALSPEALDVVPAGEEFMITDLFRRCMSRNLPVGAHLLDGDWLDVGRPEELLRANGKL